MTNDQHIQASLRKLEEELGPDAIYDFFSGFHDVVVLGHTSSEDDNPHSASEQPSHALYHIGAKAAEALRAQLRQN